MLLVFFIYGLAFFSLGLILLLESTRSSSFLGVRQLGYFGLIHGVHEWVEMVIRMGIRFNLPQSPLLEWVRLGLLCVSFFFLIAFSLQVLNSTENSLTGKKLALPLLWFGFYLLILMVTLNVRRVPSSSWGGHVDVLARYLLAVPGAALAAGALRRQATEAGKRRVASCLQTAALWFGLYSLTQVFVRPFEFFPPSVVNSTFFLETTGLPIQAVRAVLAVLITISLMRASHQLERERQAQFIAAQSARLEALEQVQIQLVERENLRRELLRHTVTAQEEERARIARELHDETAQFLTALNLNLSALGERLRGNLEAETILDRLAALSRGLSQGIYHMVHDLRPAQLDDLGLVPALQSLCGDVRQRSGLQVNLSIEGARQRLDPLLETVLFRVAQEALANAARHSECPEASLRLCFEPGQVVLEVQDAGVGFDPQAKQTAPRGWGLAGMRERAESAGGRFELRSSPGAGTLVTVSIPIQG